MNYSRNIKQVATPFCCWRHFCPRFIILHNCHWIIWRNQLFGALSFYFNVNLKFSIFFQGSRIDWRERFKKIGQRRSFVSKVRQQLFTLIFLAWLVRSVASEASGATIAPQMTVQKVLFWGICRTLYTSVLSTRDSLGLHF